MKTTTLIEKLVVLSLFCWMLISLSGVAGAQTWTELGTNAPDLSPGDIWQTNSGGGAAGVTGGLNYYTDDYPANLGNVTTHGGAGQVFQMGKSNMVLTSVTIKTFSTDEGASSTSTGTSANYRLRIYRLSIYWDAFITNGTVYSTSINCTQLASYAFTQGFTPGDWVKIGNLGINLQAYQSYAYTFTFDPINDGNNGTWDELGYGPEGIMATNSGLNPAIPDHGCIVMINPLGNTNGAVCPVILGTRTNVNAAFILGQILPGAPIVSMPQASPATFYAQSVPGTTLTVNLGGLTPFTNCWQTDGGGGGALTNIPGTDTRGTGTLLTYAFSTSTAGTYKFCVVSTNKAGVTTSGTAEVVVNAASAPILTSDVAQTNVYAFAGGNVALSATFGTGTLPVSNQWQVMLDSGGGYTDIAGANSNGLAVSDVAAASAGNYHLVATNIIGNSTSSPAHITVLADPPPPTNAPYPKWITTNNPVVYWRLGEHYAEPSDASMQAYDYSGNKHMATYGTGARVDDGSSPWNGPQPPSAGGLYPGFEATNYCALTTNNGADSKLCAPDLNLNTNAVTITMWINPTPGGTAANEGLFMWADGNDKAGLGFGGKQNADSMAELGYVWNSNSAASYNWDSGLYPPAGEWSFVALTITATNSTIYLYYTDGYVTNAFKAVQTVNNNVERFSGGTTWIGSDSYDGRNFGGKMDEVAVFNRALSESDIQDLFLKSLGAPLCSLPPSPQPTPPSQQALPTQVVHITVNGGGIPAPGYQWQYRAGGSTDPFVNLTEGVGVHGSQTSTLTVTSSASWDLQVVLTNMCGSSTSSVATLDVICCFPMFQTINFQYTNTGAGYGAIPPFIGLGRYTGRGAVGTGTYWNSIGDTNPTPGYYAGPRYSATNTFLDDGVTPSGPPGANITCTVQSGGNFTCLSYTTNSDNILTLLGMYSQQGGTLVTNGLVFSNCPAGLLWS